MKSRSLYFSKYKCAFCSSHSTRYICATTSKRKYIVCDNKDCREKVYLKLRIRINAIRGIDD